MILGTCAVGELQPVLDAIGTGAFVVAVLPDGDIRCLACNARARCWMGIGQDDISGKPLAEVFGAEAGAALAAQCRRCVAAGSAIDTQAEIARNGVWLHTVLAPLPDAEGRIVRILATCTDVTERRQLARALEKAEERLRNASRLARFGCWETDLETGLDFWTEEAYSILGLPPRDSPPTMATFLERVHPEDRAALWWAQEEVLASQEPCSIEYRAVRPDGAVRHIHSRAVAIRDAAGHPIRVFGVGLDITERKEAEAAVHAARQAAERADRAKSRFLAAASHDLRQPLQAQVLFHEILAQRNADPALSDLIARMGQTLKAQQQILTGLLSISQIEAGIVRVAPRDFPVQPLLDRLVAEVRPQADHQGLACRAVACSLTVHSDPELLERILRNLLTNALKYTRRGGILLGCRRHGSEVLIQVWDTGSGIPADQTRAIFEEFYQVDNPARDRDKGLGLGLAIVDRLSRMLGHPVEVRSTVGRGTLFQIRVPLARSGCNREVPPVTAPP